MPIVLIRDPYSWMHSMCHNGYTSRWKRSRAHCPNLVEETNKGLESVPVTVPFRDKPEKWESLVHLWTDWYKQYIVADYPRLIVR
jgi:hypothetical protein